MKVVQSFPYNQHRDIAILIDRETILLENGKEEAYKSVPKGTKIFAPYPLVIEIWKENQGAAAGQVLKHNNTIRKWRLEKPAHYKSIEVWRNHPSEVNVLRHESFPENPRDAIEALSTWRDWIEQNGGHIKGSVATSSWTIFRSKIDREWTTPYYGLPEIEYPLGGRLLECKRNYITCEGRFVQWDLLAAYSRTLSKIQFGGKGSGWYEIKNKKPIESLIDKGILFYIEAQVKIPDLETGPLPIRRERKMRRPMYEHISYPTNTVIEGIWTAQEIFDAISVGCEVKIRRKFMHHATGEKYHFVPWYHVMEQGRNTLHGFARTMAKQTANSLWGRFAQQNHPSRTVWRENGKRRPEYKKHPARPFAPRSNPELADHLCGQIRSELFRLRISAGNYFLQGNVDGAWIEYASEWQPPSDDWRAKKQANRIEFIDASMYRYWPIGEEDPVYITPGINREFREKIFIRTMERNEAKWQQRPSAIISTVSKVI